MPHHSNEIAIEKLLHYVRHSKSNKIENMLQKNPELLIMKGAIIDPRSAVFIYVSAWQYMLWSQDMKMIKMAISCIPANKTSSAIKDKLIKQYYELEEKGIPCDLCIEEALPPQLFRSIIIDEVQDMSIIDFKFFGCSPMVSASYLELDPHIASPRLWWDNTAEEAEDAEDAEDAAQSVRKRI